MSAKQSFKPPFDALEYSGTDPNISDPNRTGPRSEHKKSQIIKRAIKHLLNIAKHQY